MNDRRGRDEAPADGWMVRLEDIHLKLESAAGEVNILRGLDLAVAAGETVSIVGPSGSGKSTMMMVVAGLERPTAGRVAVAGQDLSALGEDGLALFRRERIGIVFQDFHLIPTMSALENVAVPLELAGQRDAFERAENELHAVGLGHRLGHYPGQLSGGEQQRVALARAFVIAPRLLLADEPTGNLDGETGRHIIDLMFALRAERGTTLLLITHDPMIAARCARTVRLIDGKIAHDETSVAAAPGGRPSIGRPHGGTPTLDG
jgi:putative ABC transport system ATP-binding protein